ncbi:CTP synthase C-terminal region-related (seleno)protein [Pseudonocardia sp. TRM90224]|uniref:CTP synthase C-terminal region-related (seleno)protein n=1 Tax=Pseudonocardia sp. TRM90224 TaxID=2812678 RepID=UPI001E5C9A7D|nr:hypothetical protein [Pseudonocardia sp. TRM90224]
MGDRSPAVRSHVRIPALLDALAERDELVLDAYWVPTDDAAEPGAVDGFDAVWTVPGSPYRNEAGALAAIRTARERHIPFLGTCGGFQHAVLEFARTVCGLDVDHAENTPGSTRAVIVPLACSLAGHERAVRFAAGSRVAEVIGADRTVESYVCSYGPDPAYLDTLRRHGMVFTGHDDEGEVRVLELPEHPFFLATLFQPELAGDGTRPHPLVVAFARAAAEHALTRT